MFDITNLEAIRSNPILAKEFVKYLSPYELMTVVNDGLKYGNFILDEINIVDGILDSGEDGKILFLASEGNLNHLDDRGLMQIYKKGEAFRAALLGNARIDWYSVLSSEGMLDVILADVMQMDSKLKIPFYKNPRMDRRLIASIIRAKEKYSSRHRFNLSQISFSERYVALKYSFDAKEIPSECHFSKDGPDNNDLCFFEPICAALVFIRDLFESEDIDFSGRADYCLRLIQDIDKVQLGVDYSDWLSVAEERELDKKYSGDPNRFVFCFGLATERVFSFFDEKTILINSAEVGRKNPNENGLDLVRHYASVCLALKVVPNLLSKYSNDATLDRYLSNLLQSSNWVMRSAGYSYLFQNLVHEDGVDNLRGLINKYEGDAVALVWGIFANSNYYLLTRVNYEAKRVLAELFNSVEFDETMKEFFRDIESFIFGCRYREAGSEDLEKLMEEKNAKNSYISKNILHAYISSVAVAAIDPCRMEQRDIIGGKGLWRSAR